MKNVHVSNQLLNFENKTTQTKTIYSALNSMSPYFFVVCSLIFHAVKNWIKSTPNKVKMY